MSSRKDAHGPRRSCRERQAIYMSLDENFLFGSSTSNSLLRSLVDQANKSEHSIDSSFILPPSNYRPYSTRSKNRLCLRNYCVPINGNSDGEEYDDSEPNTKLNLKEDSIDREIKNVSTEPNMYESVKRRRQAMKLEPPHLSNKGSSGSVSRRHSGKKENSNDIGDQRNGDTIVDDDVDTEEIEPRHYALRTNRNPVSRFCVEPSNRRTYLLRRDDTGDVRTTTRKNTRRRYYGRSNSSSSTDSRDGGQQHHETNKEERFERRNRRRINKARSHMMPVNMGDEYCTLSMDIHELLRHRTGSDLDPMIIDGGIDFKKVGGLESHIHSLKEIVLFPLLYPEVFNLFEITPPKGVLFYGPPGTGKTLVARALANACSTGDKKVAFFMRKGADCLSKWVGESERQLLFDQAYSMRPSIIFFDEIDGLAPVRSSKQDQIHSSIVSTLLALMDGLDNRGEVVVIGATNRLDAIDPALRRPGRFDRELGFSLPNKSARAEILQIHTSSWNANRLSDDDLEWLAEHSSGYCGADLKSLCTEAVLVALRSRFPQIYTSEKKLDIDPNELTISRADFIVAMRHIVAANRRDFSIPSRHLNERLLILLGDVINSLMKSRIPDGYMQSNTSKESQSEIQRITSIFQQNRVVPSARLLLYGSSSDMGQTSYILPAIINRLDHLPVFSLSLANIFSCGTPEQSFSHIVQAAIRSSSSGIPAVLLITSIDKWYLSVTSSVWNLIREIFRPQDSVEFGPPPAEHLEAYYNFVISRPSLQPPKIFNPEDYPVIPKAKQSHPCRKFGSEELKELRKIYDQYRLELVLHYEETIARLCRDRRFTIFAHPVDAEVVPDYYEFIKNPMDLSEMFSKASHYKSPEEFLSDFRLIYDNAVEYNPLTDYEGRQIRIAAKLLFDMGQRAVYELDSKFLKRIREIEQILMEGGVEIDDNQRKGSNLESFIENNTNDSANMVSAHNNSKLVKRKATSEHKFNRKRRCFVKTDSKRNSNEGPAESNSPHDSSGASEVLGVNCDMKSEENGEINRSDEGSAKEEVMASEVELKIDVGEIKNVVMEAVKMSNGWSIGEIERLAAEFSQAISRFDNCTDRMDLPGQLIAIITKWEHFSRST